MKTIARFYVMSQAFGFNGEHPSKPIPSCYATLDGRQSLSNLIKIAKEKAADRGYCGLTIEKMAEDRSTTTISSYIDLK